jgi:hypothetical protein
MLASVEVHVARIVIFGNFGGTSKDKPDFHYFSGDTALCGCSSASVVEMLPDGNRPANAMQCAQHLQLSQRNAQPR